jgi:hypothetical protein
MFFSIFRENLFAQAATAMHRDSQTAETLSMLDESINSFLIRLSDHFLTPGSFKSLEYLIRRYR